MLVPVSATNSASHATMLCLTALMVRLSIRVPSESELSLQNASFARKSSHTAKSCALPAKGLATRVKAVQGAAKRRQRADAAPCSGRRGDGLARELEQGRELFDDVRADRVEVR